MKLKEYLLSKSKKENTSLRESIDNMANAVGLSSETIMSYCYNKRIPSASSAIKIHRYTNKKVSLEDMLFGDVE